jgi:hypothetical protein
MPKPLVKMLLAASILASQDFVVVAAARADVRIIERTSGQLELLISGTITERDAKAFEALSPELERGLHSEAFISWACPDFVER